MVRSSRSAFCAIALVLLVGCSRGSGEAVEAGAAATSAARIGSCDRGAITGTCSEYVGGYLAQNEILLTSTCAKLGGTFVYAECPNTSVVGACRLSTTEVRKFYATGGSPYDPTRAKEECATSFRGTWEPHR